jgi:carboxymethylenebutenolidase
MKIKKGMVEIPGPEATLPAFVARPSSEGPHAAVIVVMEAFGLNDHIKNVTSRLAAEGYVTLAPDLYHREGGVTVSYDNLPEAIRLMNGLKDEQILADTAAAVDYLQQQAFVAAERIGMTGFCMGGRATFLVACNNPAIKAAVPFYGGGIAGSDKAPLDDAGTLEAPMLLLFGEKDAFIPLEQVETIKQRLTDLGKQADTVVYEGADHGFFCDERPSYNTAAAQDAWRRLTEFFARHLGT